MPRGWLARTKKPNQPVSPVDWLETAERELSDTRKGSSEGQSPRRSFFCRIFRRITSKWVESFY